MVDSRSELLPCLGRVKRGWVEELLGDQYTGKCLTWGRGGKNPCKAGLPGKLFLWKGKVEEEP